MPRIRSTVPAAALLAVLAATGCSSTAASDDTTPAASTSSSAEASIDIAAGPACLVGEWVLTVDALRTYYDAVNAGLAATGISLVPEGTAGLTIRADGTYVYTPDLRLTGTIGDQSAEVQLGGSLEGVYEATASTLTTGDTVEALTLSASVGGIAVDGSAIAAAIAAAPFQSSTYDCSGDTPVIGFSTGTSTVPITLARP